MTRLNATHDPARRSWVESANAHGADFPIQNLPFGVFSEGDGLKRVGVAIGDRILDLTALEAAGTLVPAPGRTVFAEGVLNPFMGAAAGGLVADPGADRRVARRNDRRAGRAGVGGAGRRHDAPADLRAQLHRFLRLTRTRQQRGQHVPRAGQRADAELAAPAGGLQRPRLHGGGLGHGDPPAERATQGPRCRRAHIRAVPPARYRAGDGRHRRHVQCHGPAGYHGPGL